MGSKSRRLPEAECCGASATVPTGPGTQHGPLTWETTTRGQSCPLDSDSSEQRETGPPGVITIQQTEPQPGPTGSPPARVGTQKTGLCLCLDGSLSPCPCDHQTLTLLGRHSASSRHLPQARATLEPGASGHGGARDHVKAYAQPPPTRRARAPPPCLSGKWQGSERAKYADSEPVLLCFHPHKIQAHTGPSRSPLATGDHPGRLLPRIPGAAGAPAASGQPCCLPSRLPFPGSRPCCLCPSRRLASEALQSARERCWERMAKAHGSEEEPFIPAHGFRTFSPRSALPVCRWKGICSPHSGQGTERKKAPEVTGPTSS